MSHAIGVVAPQTLVSRLRCSLSDFSSPIVLHCYTETLSAECKGKMTDYHPCIQSVQSHERSQSPYE